MVETTITLKESFFVIIIHTRSSLFDLYFIFVPVATQGHDSSSNIKMSLYRQKAKVPKSSENYTVDFFQRKKRQHNFNKKKVYKLTKIIHIYRSFFEEKNFSA